VCCTARTGTSTATTSLTVNAPPSKGGGLDIFSLAVLGLFAAFRRRRLARP